MSVRLSYWIRDCKNISQKEIAEYLGIKQQQYARYEKGVNVMPATYLGPICKFLDISADYLLDLINEPISLKEQKGIQ
ncbi:TPA: helix-turn-helix transcriptional regulator [Candidatus Ventrenecus avicola]|nr:helix-turn-helix transcriptional regulator [Candidatus Ventrenecus avicola]